MKSTDMVFTERDRSLVTRMSSLPRKILRNHEVVGLSQMVLHDLGHEGGFGFTKATFLIDNPDFDHLIGAAGYDHSECCLHKADIWEAPQTFASDMESAKFNEHIRRILNGSLRRKDINLDDARDLELLGKEIGLNDPRYFSWDMKHGNHGVLLYENDDSLCVWRKGLLRDMSAVLGMCPLH